MMGTPRDYLRQYTYAVRNMEIAHAAINILEGMNTREATQAINVLKRGQQKQLNLLDAAAAKLGAPYPTKEQG